MSLLEEAVNRQLEHSPNPGKDLLYNLLKEYKAEVVSQMIDNCSGNMSEAARRLGIHRNTIRVYINKQGMYRGKGRTRGKKYLRKKNGTD
jgi:DNA-binding NtrC family response regulator